jgi:hypothetical protein
MFMMIREHPYLIFSEPWTTTITINGWGGSEMATQNELAAFEGFEFRVGQRVKTKLAGYATGLVIERTLTQDGGGIDKSYIVRHDMDSFKNYREFELESTP